MLSTLSNEAKILIGIGIASVVILIGAILFLSKPIEQTASQTVVGDQTKLLVRKDSFKIASDSAKVTLVEFADFQCPACKSAHPVLVRLEDEYSGRVNFVFRHFPLPQHKNALLAALSAEASGEQGKFWQYHDKLYETQTTWENEGNPTEIFLGYAKELKLDETKFKESLDTKKFEEKINQDIADGTSLGVNSTPTFFVQNQKYNGALSYKSLKNILDEALK